jgi:hypothetical protein
VDTGEEATDEENALGRSVLGGRERCDAIGEGDGRRCLAIGHHAVLKALAEHGARHEFGDDALVVEHESPCGEKSEVKLARVYGHDGSQFELIRPARWIDF